MTQLKDLQETFQAAMDSNPSQMRAHILETKSFIKKERLDIYVYAYGARLQESLAADFAKVQKYLGERRFNVLTKEYVSKHPSRTPSLRWYGLNFPEWLRQSRKLKYPDALADLAAFESKLHSAFDAQDCPALTMDYVSTLPGEAWPELFLQAHPSLHLFDTHYNSVAIWQDLDHNRKSQAVKKLDTPISWRIWRRNYQTYFRSTPSPEAWAMQEVHKGITFADLCSGLCDFVPEESAAMEAATLLKMWLQDEVLRSHELFS